MSNVCLFWHLLRWYIYQNVIHDIFSYGQMINVRIWQLNVNTWLRSPCLFWSLLLKGSVVVSVTFVIYVIGSQVWLRDQCLFWSFLLKGSVVDSVIFVVYVIRYGYVITVRTGSVRLFYPHRLFPFGLNSYSSYTLNPTAYTAPRSSDPQKVIPNKTWSHKIIDAE